MLRRALDEDSLTCVYRPVVQAKTLEPAHLLAEFRVETEDDALGASEILRLCEATPELRRSVDQAACRRLLSDPALEGETVAIDVAIRSMLTQDLVAMLLDFARRMGKRRLILRLVGLRDTAVERVEALETLRRAGFSIALHAKELGPVTEKRLERLPVDYLLLDPGLVVDPDALRHSVPSLHAMTERCAKHKVAVVFEGIVEAEAVRLLNRIGRALLSGPYFGDPRART
jgi:EAL domain-containing protein (putative c-di-GMP-specific phosphodiesterase class I)